MQTPRGSADLVQNAGSGKNSLRQAVVVSSDALPQSKCSAVRRDAQSHVPIDQRAVFRCVGFAEIVRAEHGFDGFADRLVYGGGGARSFVNELTIVLVPVAAPLNQPEHMTSHVLRWRTRNCKTSLTKFHS